MAVPLAVGAMALGCSGCWSGARQWAVPVRPPPEEGRQEPREVGEQIAGRRSSLVSRDSGGSIASRCQAHRLSTLEQTVRLIQLKVQQLLQLSWIGGVGSKVRQNLEEISQLIKLAEQPEEAMSEASDRRRSHLHLTGTIFQRRTTPLFQLKDRADLLDEEGRCMTETMTESRRWLVETFTGEQVWGDSSGSDSELASGSEGMSSMTAVPTRRRNTQKMQKYIDAATGAPQAVAFWAFDGQLDFDALDYAQLREINNHPLQCIGAHLVNQGLAGSLQGMLHCDDTKFETMIVRYLGHIDELYKPSVPFHSAAHATDVLITMRWFMKSSFFQEQVTAMDRFMCMVAAAIHDVGHPGRNNDFMKKTSPLAQTYFDDAILEHMHLSIAFEAMSKHPELNWLALLHRKCTGTTAPGHENLQNYVRRGLIEMVLDTDMAKHDHYMRKLHAIVDELPEDRDLEGSSAQEPEWMIVDRKLFILSEVLHAADISNPVKPHPIMLKWTERVLEEFWAQGDEERSLGLDISPLCDRESGARAVPKGQIGFINFVVLPFYQIIAKLTPEAEEAVANIHKNLEFWKEKDSERATPATIFPQRPLL